jgi:hypothetical protein
MRPNEHAYIIRIKIESLANHFAQKAYLPNADRTVYWNTTGSWLNRLQHFVKHPPPSIQYRNNTDNILLLLYLRKLLDNTSTAHKNVPLL